MKNIKECGNCFHWLRLSDVNEWGKCTSVIIADYVCCTGCAKDEVKFHEEFSCRGYEPLPDKEKFEKFLQNELNGKKEIGIRA